MHSYQMADIHTHMIPGVDDGSFYLEMSKTMLMMAYIQGVHTVFATPHSQAFISDKELVLENYQKLLELVESFPFQQKVLLGCEVRCELRNIQETLQYLKSGKFPSMNKTNYVLTEFSTNVLAKDAMEMISLLQEDGWIPIIAHVERYSALFQGDTIENIINSGCLLQINAYSLDDEPNEYIVERARKLVLEEKVAFLGSDAHRLNHRPPSVEQGLRYLYEHCRKEYADAVAFENAENFLTKSNKSPTGDV